MNWKYFLWMREKMGMVSDKWPCLLEDFFNWWRKNWSGCGVHLGVKGLGLWLLPLSLPLLQWALSLFILGASSCVSGLEESILSVSDVHLLCLIGIHWWMEVEWEWERVVEVRGRATLQNNQSTTLTKTIGRALKIMNIIRYSPNNVSSS